MTEMSQIMGAQAVESIAVTPFRLEYGTSVNLSDGVRKDAKHLLITVRTTAGVVGYAECIPRPTIYGESLETATAFIENMLAPAVVGLPITATEVVAARLAKLVANPAARSAVEIAVIDALGKTLGLPAYRLFGGDRNEVACTAILGSGDPDGVVQVALAEHGRGVTSFKLKVGANVEQDIRTVEALRAALSGDVLLYADANGRFNLRDAVRFLRGTADHGLWGIEEPNPGHELAGRARLARYDTLVIGDETCSDPRAVASEIAAERATAVSIKVARTGVVASRRIRELCHGMGIPVLYGTQADSALGALVAGALASSSVTSHQHEPAELLFFQNFAQQITCEPPAVVNGRLQLSELPGFGYKIDSGLVKECAIA